MYVTNIELKIATELQEWSPSHSGENLAIVNQHPPAHHEGWMISGQETVFCWIPVP